MKTGLLLLLIAASLTAQAQMEFDTTRTVKWLNVVNVPFGRVYNR